MFFSFITMYKPNHQKGDTIMVIYRIKHHVPGRIKIEVPFIKGLSISALKELPPIPIPAGIKDVRPNPLTGSVVITYEPKNIDIVKYLEDIAFHLTTQNLMGTAGKIG